ncbi:tellurium resistance protein TerC [Clostridioides difficile]|nr:tellurium resistance protein TerC [Clostridioides difficile]
MEKRNLRRGIVYVVLGATFLFSCLMTKDKLSSLLVGLAGGFGFNGISIIYRYFYWNKHKEEYREKLEEEKINLQDERNVMYRDKAGRYAYIVCMIIIPISAFVFSLLNALDIYNSLVIIIYLSVLWIVLYVVGVIYYRKLKNNG